MPLLACYLFVCYLFFRINCAELLFIIEYYIIIKQFFFFFSLPYIPYLSTCLLFVFHSGYLPFASSTFVNIFFFLFWCIGANFSSTWSHSPMRLYLLFNMFKVAVKWELLVEWHLSQSFVCRCSMTKNCC